MTNKELKLLKEIRDDMLYLILEHQIDFLNIEGLHTLSNLREDKEKYELTTLNSNLKAFNELIKKQEG